jgi:hypothetical protein
MASEQSEGMLFDIGFLDGIVPQFAGSQSPERCPCWMADRGEPAEARPEGVETKIDGITSKRT